MCFAEESCHFRITMTTARVILMLILLYITGESVQGRKGTMDDWIRLTNTLFANYTKEIYPVYNFTDVLMVDTAMMLLSIVDFDELAGIITVNAVLVVKWTDYRLKWDPNDYGGIEDIFVNASNVWKPYLYVQTTAQDLEPIGSNQFDVRINHTGHCIVLPGRLLRSSCVTDMRRFPVDSQVCDIVIRQWGIYPDEIQLVHTRKTFVMSAFSPNGEWNLDKTSVSEFIHLESPNNGVVFSIHITRKSMFFIIYLIMPVLILCFLNPFVFLFPASSGERISYTITMFLSLAVYMTLIGDNLPKVSDNMAGMTYFLLFALIYSGLLILLTIFTLRCEAVSDVCKFPKWLQKLTRFIHKLGINQQESDYTLNTNETREEYLDKKERENKLTDDVFGCVHKDDVTKLIDTSLFMISFGLMLGGTLWFLVYYYT
ncbi:acetylcholine receptor subunit beta-type unc-29-like [Mizuhopecten yessoensis]|uniref:Neuronal acetylcholine receptor subunit alpha-7 n=1 Tax=Mizuhopecten yessoensis TaxID=6573 RepID=A0A210R4S0_MIZYE|nr:acetylcholine receptor subunit beta-type unc-29-like [Mizuhopecten yessoensis]OWF55904.1 Neuronal acetylcholine receptor subunit alpha-7 [Mizuhopecten yessoensis]